MQTLLAAPNENVRLDSGLTVGLELTAAGPWYDGLNVVFRNGGVEALPGDTLLQAAPGQITLLDQAFVPAPFDVPNFARRYYFGTRLGGLYSRTETTLPGVFQNRTILAESSGDAIVSSVPFGAFLVATSNSDRFIVWKNDLGPATDLGALTDMTRVGLVRRLGPHVLAFDIDGNPMQTRWCSADNVEDWDFTSVTNSAGELTLRDLSSRIVAVEELGQDLAVYGKDCVGILRYLGAPFYFGFKRTISSIGVGWPRAVVSVGAKNYGLGSAGVWVTDGTAYNYVDAPAMQKYIKDTVDHDRPIIGFHDENLRMVRWSYFPLGGTLRKGFGLFYDTGAWTKFSFGWLAGMPKDVFDTPIYSRGSNDADTNGYVPRGCGGEALNLVDEAFVLSRPLDFGDDASYKRVSELRIGYDLIEGGGLSYAIRAGDDPEDLTMYDNGTVMRLVYPPEHEAVYFALRFTGYGWRIAVLKVRGWGGGTVA